MNAHTKKVLDEALELPASERALIVVELDASLENEDTTEEVQQAWDAEIERRGAEVDLGTLDAMALDEYRVHVQQRRAARARR